MLVRTVGAALALYAGLSCLVLVLARETGRLLPDNAGAAVQHGAGWTALITALAAYGFLILGIGIGTVYQLVSRPWMLVRAGAIGVVGQPDRRCDRAPRSRAAGGGVRAGGRHRGVRVGDARDLADDALEDRPVVGRDLTGRPRRGQVQGIRSLPFRLGS